MGATGDTLLVDALTRDSIDSLVRTMRDAGYRPGEPILDVTGDGPGLVTRSAEAGRRAVADRRPPGERTRSRADPEQRAKLGASQGLGDRAPGEEPPGIEVVGADVPGKHGWSLAPSCPARAAGYPQQGAYGPMLQPVTLPWWKPVDLRHQGHVEGNALNVPSVSVVVPVYRSESSLLELTRRLHATFATYPSPVEIILVEDDGGEGLGADCQLARADGRVRGFRHSRNYGQHNALLTGIRQARHEVIVTLDDDLQNPPEEIPKLLAELARGHDAVYGTPIREQHGLFRDFASKVTKIALQGYGCAYRPQGERLPRFPHRPARGFCRLQQSQRADRRAAHLGHDTIRCRRGATRPTHTGASNYTIRQLVRHAMNMATGYSVVPLKVASLIGFVFTLFGMGLLVYVVGGYFIRGTTVQAFPFCVHHCAVLRCTDVCAGHHRGEPGANPSAKHGATCGDIA